MAAPVIGTGGARRRSSTWRLWGAAGLTALAVLAAACGCSKPELPTAEQIRSTIREADEVLVCGATMRIELNGRSVPPVLMGTSAEKEALADAFAFGGGSWRCLGRPHSYWGPELRIAARGSAVVLSIIPGDEWSRTSLAATADGEQWVRPVARRFTDAIQKASSDYMDANWRLPPGLSPDQDDARYWLGWTALHYGGHAEAATLEALLDEPDADARAAAQVASLVAAGADPNVGAGIWTPLHACMWVARSPGDVKTLLAAGADIEARNAAGRTPLGEAMLAGGDYEYLLRNGADINAADNDGWTPLHHAVTYGDEYVVGDLLGRSDTTARNKAGETLLLRALHAARPETAEVLLRWRRGVDVNGTDTHGRAPLHWAAIWGNLRVTELLLKYDPDVQLCDAEGKTPLDYAVEGGHNEVAALLREHGAR